MKKSIIIILVLIFLIPINSYSRDTCDQTPKENGLCGLVFDVIKYKEQDLIGKIYFFECCDDYFTLTQFIEPDLLVFTWIPEGRYCWGAQRAMLGRKIIFQSDKKKFEEMRRKREVIGRARFIGKDFEWGKTSFKVLKVIESQMTDGSIMKIPIIKFFKR